MKKYFVMIIVLVGYANAQSLARDSSYAATDTTVWAAIGNGNKVLVFRAYDSCNVKLEVDYSDGKNNVAVYQSYTLADSTNSVVGAGMFRGYVLRMGGTNNIPGAGAIRLRVTKIVGNGKNGTTTPKYDAYIKEY